MIGIFFSMSMNKGFAILAYFSDDQWIVYMFDKTIFELKKEIEKLAREKKLHCYM